MWAGGTKSCFIACLFVWLLLYLFGCLVGNFDWRRLMHKREGGKSVGRWETIAFKTLVCLLAWLLLFLVKTK